MSLRVKWFHVILLSVFHGIVAVDELLMEPTSQHTLVVREGTDVTLTCYSGQGSNLTAVKWHRGSTLATTIFNDEKNECNVTQGQIVDKGGQGHFECNRTSSTIVIQGVRQEDSKEWTCQSEFHKDHKSIKLEVQAISSSTSTTTTMTSDTQWYIILPGSLGGLAVVSLVIFLVWRNRTSRKRNLPRSIQKNRSDSEEHILEMQDNPTYWTSMEAAKSTSSQSEDAEEHEQIEMQDNPVYWQSSHDVKDHSTQLADAEKQINPVYWTLEPHCHGPPHTAGQRGEEY